MTTTYTPERQLFPPGTKVKAVNRQTGEVRTGRVLFPHEYVFEVRSDTKPLNQGWNLDGWLVARWDRESDTWPGSHNFGLGYNEWMFTQIQETAPMQSIKSVAATVRDYVKPYEKYLVAAAVLLALDHFILKGAMTDRIQRLAQSLADRLASMVDGLIARIGGE